MIYRKDNYYEKINSLTKDNFVIVSNFDRSITKGNSKATWGCLNGHGLLDYEYDIERNNLYAYYRPIELDYEMDDAVKMMAMEDWLYKHSELFKKYSLSKDIIKQLFDIEDVMLMRDGFKPFFDYVTNNNIKFNIVSSGIYDFIVAFLEKHDCYNDLVNIEANKLAFDRNGVVVGLKGEIIHAFNKVKHSFYDKDKEYTLLIGDQVSDIMMVKDYKKDNVITVGFISDESSSELESFKDVFDIVLTDDESFDIVLNDLRNVFEK